MYLADKPVQRERKDGCQIIVIQIDYKKAGAQIEVNVLFYVVDDPD